MIHVDTSALIDALAGKRNSGPRLRKLVESSQRIHLSAPVLFEWRRGPRTPEEIEDQEDLFPSDEVIAFSSMEAIVAADLYRKVKRPRGREIDIAIAACAIAHNAALWTLNPQDFRDIPNVKLV